MWISSETALLALCAALLPGTVGFAVSRAARFDAARARQATALSAALSFAAALGLGAVALASGAAPTTAYVFQVPVVGELELGLGARYDGLTALLLMTVTMVGAVVARFSIRYMDGDPNQAGFSQWIAYTLSAVLLLVVAADLFQVLVGWIATSHGLHRLLTHFADRPAAQLAARKKFVTSRLGDLFLLAAFTMVAVDFGTLQYDELFALLPGAAPSTTVPIAVLLVLGAMTKSAQFPFHTWLPDSLETPTPVSALMHAGIINMGGLLLIRMSPLLVEAPAVMPWLAAGGAVTALVGALAMLPQTDVKRKYAYSTVAQMGFMMLQCGVGAFAAATLHMVGHAFYKAHAFLASGSVVDPDPTPRKALDARTTPGPWLVVLALASGTFVVTSTVWALGIELASKPGLTVLGSILALATAQLVLAPPVRVGHPLMRIVSGAAVGAVIALLYFAGVGLFEAAIASAIPSAAAIPTTPMPLTAAIVTLFAIAFAAQYAGAWARTTRLGRAAWVHASRGFHIGTLQNRLVSRLWPVSPIASRSTHPAEGVIR